MHVGSYDFWLTCHILTGELMLIAPSPSSRTSFCTLAPAGSLGRTTPSNAADTDVVPVSPLVSKDTAKRSLPCLKVRFCNKTPITTEEALKHLLSDKGGKQYYDEMTRLDVDTEKLWATIQKTCQSRTLTWLEICAHCGMCADSCFLYRVNERDPEQVPAFKIQSTLGEMVKRKGQVDNAFMRRPMEYAWSRCTCCNRCGHFCPHGIDMGVVFSYLRGLLYSQGFVPWELKIGSGMHRVYKAQMDVTNEDWWKPASGWPRKTKKNGPAWKFPWMSSTRTSCTP